MASPYPILRTQAMDSSLTNKILGMGPPTPGTMDAGQPFHPRSPGPTVNFQMLSTDTHQQGRWCQQAHS